MAKKGKQKPKRTHQPVKLPGVLELTKMAWLTLWRHKGLFIALGLIYGLLNLLLVQSLSSSPDLDLLKQSLAQASAGHLGAVATSFGLFAVLIGSAGTGSNPSAGAYQFFLALIGSLAIIWALREVLASHRIRAKDAFYQGMYPLVPFVLVLLVISLQLVPLLIGSFLYSGVINSGIAVHLVEKIAWAAFYFLLASLSLYMISSSVFALYIVCLPDMTPIKALRSARELVRRRRLAVLRKLLWLPVLLLLVAALVLVPVIFWLTPLSVIVFFLLSTFGLVGVHAYGYTLYRELLNE